MELNKKLEETLDKLFPKGDKARGRAMVLVGVAQTELEKLEDVIDDVINELRDCEDYVDELK